MKNPEGVTPEERSAWLESLTPDQTMIVHSPVGYLHILLMIALTKRVLTTCKMKAGERLQILERLNKLTEGYITPAVLRLIEPIGDTECEMFAVARSLDTPDDQLGKASFEMLTRPDVFEHFTRLNPSILAALKSGSATRL
jgi:hypothetical protein